MSLAEELARLQALHAQGALTDTEFAQAKARLLSGEASGPTPALEAVTKLRRHRTDRWLGGVCGGIAAATGVESWIWRLIVVAMVLAFGAGVLLYILLWIFVPEDN